MKNMKNYLLIDEFTILNFTFNFCFIYGKLDINCRHKDSTIEGGAIHSTETNEDYSIWLAYNRNNLKKQILNGEYYNDTSTPDSIEDIMVALMAEWKYDHRLLPDAWFERFEDLDDEEICHVCGSAFGSHTDWCKNV